MYVKYRMQKPQTTLRELQSLIDLPNCACSIVVQRPAFLRSMIDLTCGATETTSIVNTLNKGNKSRLTLIS